MYVLDTNTLIYFFKGSGGVSRHLLAKNPKDIAIPSIVLFELEVGIAKSVSPQKRRLQLQELASVVQVLPFSDKEARIAASHRVELEKKGLMIGPYNMLIAAVALSNKGTLVTHNINEFKRIKGIQLEDWF
jgi:tRNA(fMet)-specific endonuclease VapC